MNYTWCEPIIDHANADKPITMKELGGIRREDGLEERFKLLEDQYEA